MFVPLSWLRDFAPFGDDAVALGRVFDELGMVVEGISYVGEGLDNVVIARVLEIDSIPNADRIRRVLVDDGSGEPVQVVCGAWNFDVGAVVPFARVGAVLPGGFEIGRRKMKGVESVGMICSERELDLGDDAAGIMVLDQNLDPGQAFADALGLERDVVFDLAIEANRPDANCVAGVARDAAARLRLPFKMPDPTLNGDGPQVDSLASIAIEAPDLCRRFVSRVITDVHIGPSPAWVQRRLTLAGMRPINNVVDASNYVMLELGQPTHPYDLDRLPGRGLRVRPARKGEVLETLDGVKRRLGDGDDCLICDAEDTPVGIAGIMGGASSEISDATTVVMLEAANFDAMTIARTSKRLNLRTEASARFERGCDPEGIDRAVGRFCELLGSGVVANGALDDRSGMRPRPVIRTRTARLNALLGSQLDDEQVRAYLAPIGFHAQLVEPGVHDVEPPSFRPDARLEVDVIEEVARHHGYDRIERTLPRSPQVGHLTQFQADRRLLRSILAGAGISEAQCQSLLGPGDHERCGLPGPFIVAANPMMQEESILRSSLLPGLLRSLAYNAARRNPHVSFFEIGSTFRVPAPDRIAAGRDAELPDERETLAVALAGGSGGAESAKRVFDVIVEGLRIANARLEAVSEPGLHPTRTARVFFDGVAAGFVGEVDPRVVEAWGLEHRVGWIEVELARLIGATRDPLEQRPLSRFPSSDIDLAFVVADYVPAAAVAATIRATGGDLLIALDLFDVYRGTGIAAGHRSLAYRLRFCAIDRTLTDDEVGEVRAQCIAAVESAHHARLRG